MRERKMPRLRLRANEFGDHEIKTSFVGRIFVFFCSTEGRLEFRTYMSIDLLLLVEAAYVVVKRVYIPVFLKML